MIGRVWRAVCPHPLGYRYSPNRRRRSCRTCELVQVRRARGQWVDEERGRSW